MQAKYGAQLLSSEQLELAQPVPMFDPAEHLLHAEPLPARVGYNQR